jgi:hypothetical protein
LVVGRLGGRLLRWIWTWPRRRARKMDEAQWRRIRGSTVPDPASRWCAMATILGLQLCKILLLDTDAFIPLHPRWVASFHYLACMPQKLPHFLSRLICSAC